MKRIIAMALMLLASIGMMAQAIKVTGSVKTETSEPLAGVAVTIKGTTTGTTSGTDGTYSIDVKKGATLVFSFLGMIEKEAVVKGNHLDIVMSADSYWMDEAVAIGYGSAKKSDLTGAVSSVKPQELKNSKIGMASSALQGVAAGVQVTSGNLKPGADAAIVIRGAGSVNAGTEPLYIVDGMPVSGLQDISTADVESIEILKDASSASIYGSRGSNGVVLITTKRGESGKGRITFSAMAGAQKMLNKQDMMNAQQY